MLPTYVHARSPIHAVILAVVWVAPLLVLVGGSNAQTRRQRVTCPTIKEALATGKTAEQVAQLMNVPLRRVEVCKRKVTCATINETLATGKTAEQVAKELDVPSGRVDVCINIGIRVEKWGAQPPQWSTCLAINKAIEEGIAAGKTVERVAAEMNMDEFRVSECHECFSDGMTTRVLSKGSGDVDGDGKRDKLTVELHDCDPVLVAQLTRLGRRECPIDARADDLRHVLGVRDIDGDRFGEVFVETGRGASTVDFTLFRLVDGQLVRMTLDGAPVSLGLGGSVTHFDSIGCGTGKLVTTNVLTSYAESPEPTRITGYRAVYALDGPRLRLLKSSTHNFAPCTEAQKNCPSKAEFRKAGYDVSCDPIPFD